MKLADSASVESAHFSGNRITTLRSAEWTRATSLRWLHLDGNLISEETTWTEGLTHMAALLELHLERNRFKSFENISYINNV